MISSSHTAISSKNKRPPGNPATARSGIGLHAPRQANRSYWPVSGLMALCLHWMGNKFATSASHLTTTQLQAAPSRRLGAPPVAYLPLPRTAHKAARHHFTVAGAAQAVLAAYAREIHCGMPTKALLPV